MRISKDDPRFDASSIVVKMDGEEIEFISISYRDKVTPGEARAGGTQLSVGDTPGQYKAEETALSMHKDYVGAWLQNLMADAKRKGFSRLSRVRHTITISYAEPDMAQLTDTLYGVRVLGSGNTDKEGSDPLVVEVPLRVWKIVYHGDVEI